MDAFDMIVDVLQTMNNLLSAVLLVSVLSLCYQIVRDLIK